VTHLVKDKCADSELGVPWPGLDSTTAMHVLEILRQLAQGGRAIITTIHQPSSRLFQTLDKLLLLSQASSPVHIAS